MITKRASKILSLFLAFCMVFTMLPTVAFAETGDVDSGVPLGVSSIITEFAALEEDIAEQNVDIGTVKDELKLLKELAVTVIEGGDTATGSDAAAETQTTVAVSDWTAEPEYNGDTAGIYTFTPALDLPEGMTLAEGVTAPSIMVTVKEAIVLHSAIALASTSESLVDQINNWAHGGAGSLDAQADAEGKMVTVTGEVTGVTKGLTLNIDEDVTVVWKANLSEDGAFAEGWATLLSLRGKGTFAVEDDAVLSSARYAVSSSNADSGFTMRVGGSAQISSESTDSSDAAIFASGKLIIEENAIISSAAKSYAIRCADKDSEITIGDSAKVQATGTDARAIYSNGHIVIQDNAQVTAASRFEVVSCSGSLEVGGSAQIRAMGQTGPAIAINNAITNITGGVVSALGGYAITTTTSVPSTLNISGGLVFAYGSSATSIVRDITPVVSGNGIILAWNTAAEATVYFDGDETHISTLPSEAAAVWATTDGKSGISYTHGENTGFVELPVTVKVPATSAVEIQPADSVGTIQTNIATAIGTADLVTVTGSKSGINSSLSFEIPQNKTVVWKAVFAADESFTGALIDLTGEGFFRADTGANITTATGYGIKTAEGSKVGVEVIGNAVISATGNQGKAIYSLSDTLILIKGGSISATNGNTIETNSQVIVQGGSISTNEGTAIKSDRAVTVDNGIVSTQSGMGIHAESAIRIQGGRVTADSGKAIYITRDTSQLYVTGGIVSAISGNAIESTAYNPTVRVQGGIVSAATGHAIEYSINYSADPLLSGGLVFAYGTQIQGEGNVIRRSYSLSGDGLVIAWNQSAGNTAYTSDEATDIIKLPEKAQAAWASQNGKGGIAYTCGTNSGFMELPVTVMSSTPPVDAAAPNITGQPVGATYAKGGVATALSVTANSPDGGVLSYQWYRNTTNSTTGGTTIDGAVNASYTPPTTAVGTTYYYCVVTNTNDRATTTKTATATSSAAAVTVTAAPLPVPTVPQWAWELDGSLKVSWDPVVGASSYQVNIYKNEDAPLDVEPIPETELYITPPIGAGRYTFAVRAVGDGINYITSPYSPQSVQVVVTSTPTITEVMVPMALTYAAG